jgi:hypothetical protein
MADLSSNPLVMDVARRLLADGRYVARVDLGELETGHLQAIVDLRWTARQAAQLIGRSVRVTTTRAEDEPGAPLVLTAVLVDR